MALTGALTRGALCHIDHVSIEWHARLFAKGSEPLEQTLKLQELMDYLIGLGKNYTGCQMPVLATQDDETYATDGKPWPEDCTEVAPKTIRTGAPTTAEEHLQFQEQLFGEQINQADESLEIEKDAAVEDNSDEPQDKLGEIDD
jgi:hypothetical protein